MSTEIRLNLNSRVAVIEQSAFMYSKESDPDKIHEFNDDSGVIYVKYFGESDTVFSIQPYLNSNIEPLIRSQEFLFGKYKFSIKPIDNLIIGDLLYAKGGIFDKNEIHVAVFFPYFSKSSQGNPKKTYVFSNLMFKRYQVMTQKYLKRFNIPFNINENHFSRWITLHEAFHNSGPLPLFSGKINKFIKKGYGFIEELRVEFSIMHYILNCIPKSKKNNFNNLIKLIITDRIFRAARFHFNPTHQLKYGMYAREVEGDAAICLLALLVKKGILNLSKETLKFTPKQLSYAIEPILNDIYNYESRIIGQYDFDTSHHRFSVYLRKTYFSVTHDIMEFLKSSACTNCHYNIRFEASC